MLVEETAIMFAQASLQPPVVLEESVEHALLETATTFAIVGPFADSSDGTKHSLEGDARLVDERDGQPTLGPRRRHGV